MTRQDGRAPQCCTAQDRDDNRHSLKSLNDFERGTLEVARCFFQTFAHPDGQSWMQSFDTARRAFETGDPAQYVFKILRVVQAMRIARRSAFCFSNPHCTVCAGMLSEGEKQLTSALEAVRVGKRSSAHIHALLLTEGNNPSQMLHEMRALCIYGAQLAHPADHGPSAVQAAYI
ncbi:hypothetical protein [Roseobacter denitrificans]|uniref:Uncharacterized protein n=1 Tax=Roseobacter denitrificans (strain ATCC 33942 / OCh 114) TaxID=375451 RepID=Q165X9_ROSDO|nr:hypothetical protein [Roseobacter denitrificans]ABG32214.1 hypothetical protein RD1_2670 [Roseobacter denitrificans OCh 114]SFF78797.1 hypothetical protein SAMN05443635_102178 [Roseobacter denitrificans OCh 114]